MGKETLIEKFKSIASSVGWKMFIWGLGMTQEQYWREIYEQEKRYLEKLNQEPDF